MSTPREITMNSPDDETSAGRGGANEEQPIDREGGYRYTTTEVKMTHGSRHRLDVEV